MSLQGRPAGVGMQVIDTRAGVRTRMWPLEGRRRETSDTLVIADLDTSQMSVITDMDTPDMLAMTDIGTPNLKS